MDADGACSKLSEDALVGYKHLQELKILKAAAARLCMQRDSSTSNAGAPFLLRSLSNIEVMPAAVQRLAGTSSSMGSSNTEQRGVPGLARLGRSNSAGSHKLSSYLPPPPGAYPLTSGQPSSTRGRSASASSGPSSPSAAAAAAAVVAALQTAVASSGTAAIDRAAAGQQHQHQQPQQLPWHRGPRHSEPASGGVGQDERVNLLLTEVESLLSERQQLTLRCGVLQKDNDQLAELVGRLMRTLQEQEAQLQELQQLQQLQQQESEQATSFMDCVVSLSLPSPLSHQQAGTASAFATTAARHQHQQHHMHHHQHQQVQQHMQRQRRVNEWLGRRQETWQEWQERVPLEHMHSGSSSTLTVSLDQQ